MTVKALKKQLMAAIAMVVVSAIALSSSTYAWFVANTEVKATGMEVTASADSGILIANVDEGTPGSFGVEASAVLSNETKALLPTYTVNTSKWYHAYSSATNNATAITDAGYSEVTQDDENKYYLANKFKIKSTGTNTHNVYVKEINLTGDGLAQTYSSAIRVLVKNSTGAVIFAPKYADGLTETPAGTNAPAAITCQKVNVAAAQVLSAVDSDGQDLEIYVYYDGQDVNCKTDNILDFKSINVEVVFTTEIPAATP